jgi:hypothetical protein
MNEDTETDTSSMPSDKEEQSAEDDKANQADGSDAKAEAKQ